MGTVEFGVIMGLIGAVIGVLTFYLGRVSAAKQEGADVATMKGDIGHIKENVGHIKIDLKNDMAEIKQSLQDDLKKHDDSIRRLHDRVDEQGVRSVELIREHEQKYHSV